MKKTLLLVNLGFAILAAATLVYAAVDSGPRSTLMSERDHTRAVKSIDDEARTGLVACRLLAGHEMALCRAERAAEKRVRLADLDARYLGTVQSQHSAQIAHIDAQYDVDRIRCDAFADDERRHCLQVATQTHGALLDDARPPA